MSAATTETVAGPTGELGVYAGGTAGGGTPAVFVHPLNMAAVVWTEVMDQLDRPCFAVDLRGHGESTRRGPFTVTDYVDDVLAVLDAKRVDAAHLVGGSIGCAVAIAAAARAPERVRSIAAFCGALDLGLEPEAVDAMADAVRAAGVRDYFEPQAAGVLAPGADPRLAALLLDLVVGPPSAPRSADLVAAVLSAGFGTDVGDSTASVRCPGLVVAGEHDPTCPPEASERLATALGTEAIVLPDAGHAPMLERPTAVADLLRAHLAAVDSPRRQRGGFGGVG